MTALKENRALFVAPSVNVQGAQSQKGVSQSDGPDSGTGILIRFIYFEFSFYFPLEKKEIEATQ